MRWTMILLILLWPGLILASPNVSERVDQHSPLLTRISDQLWDWAELGYLEEKSSLLLQDTLDAAGFNIDAGVAGIPTAFTATAGHGGPVIAILGEFDALPGVSQDRTPFRNPRDDHPNGQACGHNLFGAGSTGAAIAVKEWLDDSGHPGTIRFYGTPAEEGGSGKVYMVRAGLFDDVDIVLHWHPDSSNGASADSTLANKSAKFRFSGLSAHAARAPHEGRSALDAVEAMNHMVNLLREHVPAETRIHYVITDGGKAPNVVPDHAESFFYVRHPNASTLAEIWDRVVQTAEGAALGTGTTMTYEVIHGNHSTLPNVALSQLMHDKLSEVGGPVYNTEERVFAQSLSATLATSTYRLGSESEIAPFSEGQSMGSTDVGDVSWNVPTAGLRTATFVPGTGLHSWQAVAAGGTSIGHQGMLVAAKTLALTAVALYQNPQYISAAREEFDTRRGPDFRYRALLGDREPPLDYRR